MGVPPTVNPKLSRRRFIKGVIYSSAAAASGAGYYLASAQTNSNAVMERLLSLNINGQTHIINNKQLKVISSEVLKSQKLVYFQGPIISNNLFSYSIIIIIEIIHLFLIL